VGIICASASAAHASEAKIDDLTATVRGLDATLFDAYNKCDLATLGTMVAEDLEFYHDQAGLMRGRTPFVEAIKANICGKVRRDAVAASIEVYPLRGFGAVEIGTHTFCPTESSGACKTPGAPAKFVHVWQLKDGQWLLSRVISYDHH
jgi:hypothetical protein